MSKDNRPANRAGLEIRSLTGFQNFKPSAVSEHSNAATTERLKSGHRG